MNCMNKNSINVLISVSPIPSHPDTHILDEVIQSINFWLPSTCISIMYDGVRPEQEHMRTTYEAFIVACKAKYRSLGHKVFTEHLHQAEMLRQTLQYVKTPLVLFVEHDTPLVTDCNIDWVAIINTIETGDANLVRFLHEASILQEHEYLTRGRVRVHNADFVKTIQWSQRPHLALTSYYRELIADNFTAQSRTFIEDKMHGVIQSQPWEANKLLIYYPQPNAKRSYHTDGRAGGNKFDDRLVF